MASLRAAGARSVGELVDALVARGRPPAVVFAVYYHYFHGHAGVVADHLHDPSFLVRLPGLPPLAIRDLPSFITESADPSDRFHGAYTAIRDLFGSLDRDAPKATVLVNTCEEFEAGTLVAVGAYVVLPIGPVLPAGDEAGLFEQDDARYMEWLDANPADSVVYVSFGSLARMAREQLDELLQGLEESGRPYLCVVRKDQVPESVAPPEMDARLIRNGMVVEWCDQVRVLSHAAVGCFVTHCGWNSVLESVACGVPMVAVPQWSDQRINSWLVEHEWRVGKRAEVLLRPPSVSQLLRPNLNPSPLLPPRSHRKPPSSPPLPTTSSPPSLRSKFTTTTTLQQAATAHACAPLSDPSPAHSIPRGRTMAPCATAGAHMLAARPCVSASQSMLASRAAVSRISPALGASSFASCPRISYSRPLSSSNIAVRAVSGEGAPQGLPIDLRGKKAFIAGVADDNGYGWAIAKALAAAGAEILVGTWVPALNIFETSLRRGKFDESRKLPDGSLMEIVKVYPLDAVYDCPEDVPEDVKTNKRYAGSSNWTVKEAAESVKKDFGSIDILVHSLANGPEVTKPLLETSRSGYLAAMSASSYSFISLLQHFVPIMNPGGASISLTYIASERTIPGYGGGMSSAKAALESDTRVLAFEAGRKGKIRVNTISAGPLGSRAAKAIGFIEKMIEYSYVNAPLQKELLADEVGNAAAFLVSPLASAITGSTVYVDNGLNTMAVAIDSPSVA
ncbi:hypothetical protein ACQ4PT_059558 [Festuca glaucescens]